MNRRFLSIIISVLLMHVGVSAQSRNFYHRLDVGSGNVYSFVGSNLITAFVNYFSHDLLFDNSFNYTVFSGNGNLKTKTENTMGINSRDLFNDVFAGTKLGYKSDNFGNFNWGVYGSVHYKLNQFQSIWTLGGNYNHERFSFLKSGIGFYTLFGSIEQKLKCQIEFGLQYCVPTSYKGNFGNDAKVLNNGIASHYALKIAGATDFSCGVFLDLYHFDIYKKDFSKKFKMYNLGVTFTITPKRGERYYD